MLGTLTAESIRARVDALGAQREAACADHHLAQASADALAFDAPHDVEARRGRTMHLEAAHNAERRVAEIDAAIVAAGERLALLAVQAEHGRRVSAAREAARFAEQRMKAARRFDRAVAEAGKAYDAYAALEPDLAASLRAADVADPTATRVLASRAARAVRFAAWAQAPRLMTLLGLPRATVAQRRPLAEAERALVPDLTTAMAEPTSGVEAIA